MSERPQDGAQAAVSADADPSEGLGLATPGAHEGAKGGDSGDLAVPGDERAATGGSSENVPQGATEGERFVLEAEGNRSTGEPDLSGLDPDDVPDDGPDPGHRAGPGDDERPSASALETNAAGSGSVGSRSGGQGVAASDLAHPNG